MTRLESDRIVFGLAFLLLALLLGQVERLGVELLDEAVLRGSRGAEGAQAIDEDYTCNKAAADGFNEHLDPEDHWAAAESCAGNDGRTCVDCRSTFIGQKLDQTIVMMGYSMPRTHSCLPPGPDPVFQGRHGTCIDGVCSPPFFDVDCATSIDAHLFQQIIDPTIPPLHP